MQQGPSDWTRAFLGSGHATKGTQAIRRAFLVLRVVALGKESGFGLSEIAGATGLTRPTVRRLLTALIAEGAIEQRPRTQRYRAPRYSDIIEFLPEASPLLLSANAYLDETAEKVGDTVSLTLRSGLETICVARRLGSYPVQVLSMGIGVRRPIGATSASIALMSTLAPAKALRMLRENEIHLTQKGTTSDEVMLAVERCGECGYAFRERGLVQGTRAVSIAFGSQAGEAFAALTVTAIARRMPLPRVESIAALLRECAHNIEGLLVEGTLSGGP